MKKINLILGFFLMILCLPIFFSPVQSQTPSWNFLGTPIQLTNWFDHVGRPGIAVESTGNIHITYRAHDTSNLETWYANNLGNQYGNITHTEVVDNDVTQNFEGAAIAIDENDVVHMVWLEDFGIPELYYMNNSGGAFNVIPILINVGPLMVDNFPDIAIDNLGTIWIVFNNNTGVYVTYIQNSVLGTIVKIPNTSNLSENPRIAANVYPHIVFANGTGSQKEIYYSKRIITFSTPINVTGDTSFECSMPDIFVDSSEIPYIVYQYDWPNGVCSNTSEIFYSSNLETPYYITYDVYNHTNPSIAVTSQGSVLVVYETDIGGGNENIHLKIKNSGENFQLMLNIYRTLTINPFSDLYPRIGIDAADNIHVVWRGYDGSTWNIFYNRGIQPTITTPPIPGFTIPLIFMATTVVILLSYKKYKK